MKKVWFRVRDVAQQVGLTKRAISKRIEDGKTKARREGNRYLIHQDEIDKLKQDLAKKERPSMAFIAKEVAELNQKVDKLIDMLEELSNNKT